MKYKKPKVPRPKQTLSWSEILMKIQYWVSHNEKKTEKKD